MSQNWTVEQQRALDEALVQYPVSMDRRERWKYVAFLTCNASDLLQLRFQGKLCVNALPEPKRLLVLSALAVPR